MASISLIETHLPEKYVPNSQLVNEFPEWDIPNLEKKTGILGRYVAEDSETAADLATSAAEKLFKNNVFDKNEIDYLIFCTQSPDYFLPTSACIIQDRLGLRKEIGAIDINQGCSGYIYGLGLAKGLIASKQASNVLLLTGDTYSKYINNKDRSVRMLFGDGATATIIQRYGRLPIGNIRYGTDGSGANKLIVPAGGCRGRSFERASDTSDEYIDGFGNTRGKNNLYMDGRAIFEFAMKRVPEIFENFHNISDLDLEKIDYFVFHQANKFMLEALRKRLAISHDKMIYSFSHTGNTVSSTIPIAIHSAERQCLIFEGRKTCLIGFGVGYSWAAAILGN